jgi:hypothetical protein
MRAAHHRFSAVSAPADVEVVEVHAGGQRRLGLEDVPCQVPFLAHPGWRGHIERNHP